MNNKKEEPTLRDIYEQIRMVINTGATKEDLKVFATKEDLKKFVTKEDLKEDLKELKSDLIVEIGKARNMAFNYVDEKAAETLADAGKRVNDHKERDKKFKQELISVMKKNSFASVQKLEPLV